MRNCSFLLEKKIFLSLVFMCAFLITHLSANNVVSGDPVKTDKGNTKIEVKSQSSCSMRLPANPNDTQVEDKAPCRICGFCQNKWFCLSCTCGDCADAIELIDLWMERLGCM